MGRINPEELVKLPTFQAVTPSHSGEQIAFYWDKTGRFELYLMNLLSRETVQLTDGTAPRAIRAPFVWTRDDSAIIFAKDNDGDEQHNLFKLDILSGNLTQLTHDPRTQDYALEVHPDDRSLTVMSTKSGQMNIHNIDLETHEWTQFTDFRLPASGGGWSPDGQWFAFDSNESSDMKNQDIYVVRQDGDEVKKVCSVSVGSKDGYSHWHPDGQRMAVTSDAAGTSRTGLLNVEAGDIAWLTPNGVEEYAGHFSKNGQWLSATRNEDACLSTVIYDVKTGEARRLNLSAGLSMGTHFVLGDSKLLIVHTAANRRPELVLYDLETDTFDVLLEAQYGNIDPAAFATDEYIHYPSTDGKPVPAILYTPQEIEPGAKLPALVVVHGGPTGQWFRGFDPYAQFLVDLGYVVLEPNVRGSTGYGVAWRDLNLMDWGGGDLEDIAAGAAYLKTLDYVDPTRIGVFGGSYGGYMSFIAVVKKPDVFKVGVPWVGITDLHALYEESMPHFKYYLEQQMGDPAQNKELWDDRSAATHAHQLKAKLLILHGLNDPRCPIRQARIFRDRIVASGKREGTGPEDDFEYHEFAEEGHGSGDVQQKLRTYRLLEDFLERRL